MSAVRVFVRSPDRERITPFTVPRGRAGWEVLRTMVSQRFQLPLATLALRREAEAGETWPLRQNDVLLAVLHDCDMLQPHLEHREPQPQEEEGGGEEGKAEAMEHVPPRGDAFSDFQSVATSTVLQDDPTVDDACIEAPPLEEFHLFFEDDLLRLARWCMRDWTRRRSRLDHVPDWLMAVGNEVEKEIPELLEEEEAVESVMVKSTRAGGNAHVDGDREKDAGRADGDDEDAGTGKEQDTDMHDLLGIFVREIKLHSYILLELHNEATAATVAALEGAAPAFFALPPEVKARCVAPSIQRYLGYRESAAFAKELFMYRQIEAFSTETRLAADGLWPPSSTCGVGGADGGGGSGDGDVGGGGGGGAPAITGAAAFRPAVERAFRAQRRVCEAVSIILARFIGLSAEATLQLLEPPAAPAAPEAEHHKEGRLEATTRCVHSDRRVTMSNMTVFRYAHPGGKKQAFVHCPHHTDVGLCTVIPRCSASGPARRMAEAATGGLPTGGLHVFDWARDEGKWIDIERGPLAPDNQDAQDDNVVAASGAPPPPMRAVVMIGETMQRLSGNFFLATCHEVSRVSAFRFSCPMQYLANAEFRIDCEHQLDMVRLSTFDMVATSSACSTAALPFELSASSRPVVSAGKFVHDLSRQRISSNFPRDTVIVAATSKSR